MWTGGTLEVQFRYLKKSNAFVSVERRDEVRQRLNEISGVSFAPEAVDRLRSFPLSNLPDDASLNQLLAVFDWVLDELRNADA